MKKRYVYLSLFGAALCIIFFVTVFLSQTTKKPAPPKEYIATTSSRSKKIAQSFFPSTSSNNTEITPNAEPLFPENVAMQFYAWYTSTPTSPLISGTYKNSPYLDSDYKADLASIVGPNYTGGYDPVFCMQNRTRNITRSEPDYNAAGTKATVILQKNDGFSTNDLYRILLVKNADNQWVISDSICIPQKK